MYHQQNKRPAYGPSDSSGPKIRRFDERYSQKSDVHVTHHNPQQWSGNRQFGSNYEYRDSSNTRKTRSDTKYGQDEPSDRWSKSSGQSQYERDSSHRSLHSAASDDRQFGGHSFSAQSPYKQRQGGDFERSANQSFAAFGDRGAGNPGLSRSATQLQNNQNQKPVSINFDVLKKAKQSIDKLSGRRPLPGDKLDSEVDNFSKEGDEFYNGSIQESPKSKSITSQDQPDQPSTLAVALNMLRRTGFAKKAIEREETKKIAKQDFGFNMPSFRQNDQNLLQKNETSFLKSFTNSPHDLSRKIGPEVPSVKHPFKIKGSHIERRQPQCDLNTQKWIQFQQKGKSQQSKSFQFKPGVQGKQLQEVPFEQGLKPQPGIKPLMASFQQGKKPQQTKNVQKAPFQQGLKPQQGKKITKAAVQRGAKSQQGTKKPKLPFQEREESIANEMPWKKSDHIALGSRSSAFDSTYDPLSFLKSHLQSSQTDENVMQERTTFPRNEAKQSTVHHDKGLKIGKVAPKVPFQQELKTPKGKTPQKAQAAKRNASKMAWNKPGNTVQKSVNSSMDNNYDPMSFLKSHLHSSAAETEKKVSEIPFLPAKQSIIHHDSGIKVGKNPLKVPFQQGFNPRQGKNTDTAPFQKLERNLNEVPWKKPDPKLQGSVNSSTHNTYDPMSFLKRHLHSSSETENMQESDNNTGLMNTDTELSSGRTENTGFSEPSCSEDQESESYDPLKVLRSQLNSSDREESANDTFKINRHPQLRVGEVKPLVPGLPSLKERMKPRGNVTPLMPEDLERKPRKPNRKEIRMMLKARKEAIKEAKKNCGIREDLSVAQRIKQYTLFLQRTPPKSDFIQTLENAGSECGLMIKVEYFVENIMNLRELKVATGWVTVEKVFIFRALGDSKKVLKHFVFEKAYEILSTKSIVDILSIEDIGVEGIKNQLSDALKTEVTYSKALAKAVGPEMAPQLLIREPPIELKNKRPHNFIPPVELKKEKARNIVITDSIGGFELLQARVKAIKNNYVGFLTMIPKCQLISSFIFKLMYQKKCPQIFYRGILYLDNIPVGLGEDIFFKECKQKCTRTAFENFRQLPCDELIKGISIEPSSEMIEIPTDPDGKLTLVEKFEKLLAFAKKTSFETQNQIECIVKVFQLIDIQPVVIFKKRGKDQSVGPSICNIYLANRFIVSGDAESKRFSQKSAFDKVWTVLSNSSVDEILKKPELQSTDMIGENIVEVRQKKLIFFYKDKRPTDPGSATDSDSATSFVLVEYKYWAENREKHAFCILQHSMKLCRIDFEFKYDKALLIDRETKDSYRGRILMAGVEIGQGYGPTIEGAKSAAAVNTLLPLYETTPTLQVNNDPEKDAAKWYTYNDIVQKSKKKQEKEVSEKTTGEDKKPQNEKDSEDLTVQVCVDLVKKIADEETLNDLIFAPDIPVKEKLAIIKEVRKHKHLKYESKYHKGSTYSVIFWNDLPPARIVGLLKYCEDDADLLRYRLVPKCELPRLSKDLAKVQKTSTKDNSVFLSELGSAANRDSTSVKVSGSHEIDIGVDPELSDGSISCGDDDMDETYEQNVSFEQGLSSCGEDDGISCGDEEIDDDNFEQDISFEQSASHAEDGAISVEDFEQDISFEQSVSHAEDGAISVEDKVEKLDDKDYIVGFSDDDLNDEIDF